MKRSSWITLGVLVVIAIAIVAALMSYTAARPTFRAQDFAGYPECMAGIPAEWEAGSLERSGAEDACRYVHLSR